MRLRIALLFAGVIPVTGCIHDSNANQANNVVFNVISSGEQTGIYSQQMRVINTSEQLSSLLSTVTISGDMPNPDFADKSMISIFSGTNSGCGDRLSVTSVQEDASTVIVKITMAIPGSDTGCIAIAPNGFPYVFVQIDKKRKPISLLVDVQYF